MKELRRSTWSIPLLLVSTSSFALIAALAGEGIWDWIAWTFLALPLVLAGWFLLRKEQRR